MDKNQLHLCTKCLKRYEAEECVYDTEYVNNIIGQNHILIR